VTAPGPVGPFATEQEARNSAAVREVWAARDAAPGRPLDAANARVITSACDRAGVELGAFDRRIVAWLAGWEPATVAVVAGMISRAAAARDRSG